MLWGRVMNNWSIAACQTPVFYPHVMCRCMTSWPPTGISFGRFSSSTAVWPPASVSAPSSTSTLVPLSAYHSDTITTGSVWPKEHMLHWNAHYQKNESCIGNSYTCIPNMNECDQKCAGIGTHVPTHDQKGAGITTHVPTYSV